MYDGADHVTQTTPSGGPPWNSTHGKAGSSGAAGDGTLLEACRPGRRCTGFTAGPVEEPGTRPGNTRGASLPAEHRVGVTPGETLPSSNDGRTRRQHPGRGGGGEEPSRPPAHPA
ncbi:hypothetical protein GCM10015536_38760 [Streptomyces griseomycini]|nr:hypothetical protein GCM10015536_38760 [Streptomyces griseomycini]